MHAVAYTTLLGLYYASPLLCETLEISENCSFWLTLLFI